MLILSHKCIVLRSQHCKLLYRNNSFSFLIPTPYQMIFCSWLFFMTSKHKLKVKIKNKKYKKNPDDLIILFEHNIYCIKYLGRIDKYSKCSVATMLQKCMYLVTDFFNQWLLSPTDWIFFILIVLNKMTPNDIYLCSLLSHH